MKALYQSEITSNAALSALRDVTEGVEMSDDLAQFAKELVVGVKERQNELDNLLSGLIPDFDFSRLAAVDRNVLRLGAFELRYRPEIPPAVTLNEFIEIAKKYSTAESGKFVNGVLARVLQGCSKRDWEPPIEEDVPEEAEPEAEEPEVPEVEDVDLDPDSPEAAKLARIGGWTLRRSAPAPDDLPSS
jgi:N utilization substance protein B